MAAPKPIVVLFLCLVTFGTAFAQEKSDEKSQPTQSQPSGSQQQQQQGNQPSQVEQPTFLSGKVIYADGAPADSSAKVELWCDGTVRRQTTTLNGSFSMMVGGGSLQATQLDASVAGGDPFGGVGSSGGDDFGGLAPGGAGGFGGGGPRMGSSNQVDLTGCELQASQTGYQSESVVLSFRRALDNPDIGTIVLYKSGSIAGTTTSVTTMSAPKKARKGYKKARKEVSKKKANFEKAAAELEKATDLYPEFSEAWNLLGQVRLELKDESGAQQAFESAAAGDPKYLKPLIAMMELESRRQSWDQVSQWSTQVIELHPYEMKAHFYQGFASVQLGQFDQATESFTKVRASHRADQYPYAGYLLGLMLADKGDFNGAAKELKRFLKLRPEAPEGDRINTLLSGWEEKGLLKVAQK